MSATNTWLHDHAPDAEWKWYPYVVKDALYDRYMDPELSVVYVLAGIGLVSVGSFMWHKAKKWLSPSSLLTFIPGTASLLKGEVQTQVANMIKPLTTYRIDEIPTHGRDLQAVWDEMLSFTHQDVKKDGTAFAYVYDTPHEEIKKKIDEIFLHFSNTNGLSPLAFPSLRLMETAVVSAVAKLVHEPTATGSLTTGGTESLFCAIKAYRDQAEALYGITEPEIIAPASCHPAINKACHILKIILRMIPIEEHTGTCNMVYYENAIHKGKTILLIGSSPSYPHGIIDPIADICSLAEKYNLPVHVDACIGGFVLPFIEQIWFDKLVQEQEALEFSEPVDTSTLPSPDDDIDAYNAALEAHANAQHQKTKDIAEKRLRKQMPLWDFRLPQVQSISLDLHKYGYTPKGASLIMYRNADLRKYCFYATSQWIGGLFVSPTFAGTRGGGNIATSYAALQLYGINGYKSLTRDVLAAKEGFLGAVLAQDELEVIGTPLSSIISFKTKRAVASRLNILSLGDVLEMPTLEFADGTTYTMQRKWKIEKQNRPDSIHMTLMPMHVNQVAAFKQDLPQAIRYTKENNAALSTKNTAAMYGMVVKVDGVAPSLLTEFLKEFYSEIYTYPKDPSLTHAPDVAKQKEMLGSDDSEMAALVREHRVRRYKLAQQGKEEDMAAHIADLERRQHELLVAQATARVIYKEQLYKQQKQQTEFCVLEEEQELLAAQNKAKEDVVKYQQAEREYNDYQELQKQFEQYKLEQEGLRQKDQQTVADLQQQLANKGPSAAGRATAKKLQDMDPSDSDSD